MATQTMNTSVNLGIVNNGVNGFTLRGTRTTPGAIESSLFELNATAGVVGLIINGTVGATEAKAATFQFNNTEARTYTFADIDTTFPSTPSQSSVVYLLGNPMTTTGDIIYASNTQANATPQRLAAGTAGYALLSRGPGVAPAYDAISLTVGVTGVLPLANGGTNASSYGTASAILILNASGTAFDDSTITITGAGLNLLTVPNAAGAGVTLSYLNAGSPVSNGILLATSGGAVVQSQATLGTAGTLAIPAGQNITLGTHTDYGVAYSDASGNILFTAAGSTGQVLHSGNGTAGPSFSAVSLTADVSGILPILNGGTGTSGYSTDRGVLVYDSSSGAFVSSADWTISEATGFLVSNSKRITGLADPVDAQDASTKAYVDSIAQGLSPKDSVVATGTSGLPAYTQTTPTRLTADANGAFPSLDDIALTAGDRILVKNESGADEANNGIWVVTNAGSGTSAWQLDRPADADTWTELISAFVFVQEGTTYQDTGWVCTVDSGGTMGTTPVTWVQFSAAGTYTMANDPNGTGNIYRTLSGTQFQLRSIKSTSNLLTVATTDSSPNFTVDLTVNQGNIDHGSLAGLTPDDDHTQYALLAGRSSGQILTGGTASGDDLTLKSTSNATKGDVIVTEALSLYLAKYASASPPIIWDGATTGAMTLQAAASVTNYTMIFPSAGAGTSGTLPLKGTGSAGPTTTLAFGLINLTSEVTGVLPIANGGTNISSYTTGDIIYASATDVLSKLPVGTLQYQVLSPGTAGGVPKYKSITASGSITVSADENAITIGGGGTKWYSVTAGLTGTSGDGYMYTGSTSGIAVALPASATLGDSLEVACWSSGGSVQVTCGASQTIRFGNIVTTTGIGGYLETTAVGDTLKLVAKDSNNWMVSASVGNFIVA